jgi:dipeptidyl-peptidase-4
VLTQESDSIRIRKYEVEDQIDAAKVIGNYAFVDKTRIGIFGWSYGFMVSNSLFKGNDTLKWLLLWRR